MTKVGVGVIGAGKISEQYLANMATYPDLAVRFLADLVPDRAARVAGQFGVPGFGAVPEVLHRDDVEIIVNLTIPAAHADVASAAIAAGKHVWNEKPITVDRESAVAVLGQAARAGLIVGCAPDTFLGPGQQTARRMIDRGDIGEPLTASVVFQTPGPHLWHPNPDFLYQRGGGPLMDMAPYYLTALSQVFGPLAGVAALGSSSGPTRTIGQGARAGEVIDVEVATYVTAIYDFRTGGVTQATFSFDSPLARVGVLEIAGTEATLATPDPNKFTGDIRVNKAGADDWQTIPATGVDDGAGFGRGIGVVDMARALRGGGSHRATGELALHVLDAMLATVESVQRREFVGINSSFAAIPPLPEDWDPTQRVV
jgi:predicted dehydrogenase